MTVLLISLPGFLGAQGRSVVSLDGEWTFALDPVPSGESEKWYAADFHSEKFDKVTVPHCFSVDKRYELYTGKAWYFRRFAAGAAGAGMRRVLDFDAVFYRTKIWLNGSLLGAHEGGYTPFELDVTDKLKDDNVLAVEVDNSWDTTTIPGAKTPSAYESKNAAQLYPWINYGGITRPVRLVERPDVFVRRIKVQADPDLAKKTARLQVVAILENVSAVAVRRDLKARIVKDGLVKEIAGHAAIPAGGRDTVVLSAALTAGQVTLWDQDHPTVYKAEVSLGSDTLSASFGIRKLQVKGNKLLLNGEPIRMGGANRPLDHPETGSMDPAQVLDRDLSLMKEGCMELSRINHYPVPEYLLEWADRKGLLIIEEAGNWQMTPKQMDDTMMRRKWRSQMREMVERDWNHPSIMAWSVGNEFQSQTAEGKSWVRDMGAFTKSIDSSRMITFASMIVGQSFIKKPEDEASQYVDFISANIYGNYLKMIQHIHDVYPDKAVYLSEFGIRADQVKDEGQRVAHLKEAMAAFRACDYVIGACIWTFNDYRSRFPGTNPNGYRPWGLVTPQREPRGMYTAWQEEFAPATIERLNAQTIRVTARKDFPSYTLRGYNVRGSGQNFPLRVLQPGESQELNISAGELELIKPNGFVILKKNI